MKNLRKNLDNAEKEVYVATDMKRKKNIRKNPDEVDKKANRIAEKEIMKNSRT